MLPLLSALRNCRIRIGICAVALATVLVVALPFHAALRAQQKVEALSEAEIEQLRDTNRAPIERVLVFVKFLGERTDRIRDLTEKPRRPGREQDISIADDLEDNLDDYDTQHHDVRKALPKLLKELDKWSDTLKAPPDDERYGVARKLALEAVRDLREDATRMEEEQKTWFAAHPPPKDAEGRPIPE
jgi:hypothetical protein